MAKKHYSDEFKADAVRLYETRPEASYASLAADLGIARGSPEDLGPPCAEERRVGAAYGRGLRRDLGDAAGPARSGAGRSRAGSGPQSGSGRGERQARRGARHLAEGHEVFRGRDELVIRFQFACDHRHTHEVKRMCKALGLNRASYYKWRAGKAAASGRSSAAVWCASAHAWAGVR